MQTNKMGMLGFSKVLSKTILCFFMIICITTASIGSISNWFFSRNYNIEIERLYLRTFEEVHENIQADIVAETIHIYLDITTKMKKDLDELLLEVSQNRLRLIYTIQKKLMEYVALYADTINEISIYLSDYDILLSSLSGMIFCSGNPAVEEQKNRHISNWKEQRKNMNWIMEPLNLYNTNSALSLTGSVPARGAVKSSQDIISISVTAGVIEQQLEKRSSEGAQFYFVHNDLSEHFPKDQEIKLDTAQFAELSAMKDHSIEIFRFQNSIALFKPVEGIEFGLLYLSPRENFYLQSAIIQRVILITCLIVMLGSMLLSGVFAKKLCKPVKRIIAKLDACSNDSDLDVPRKGNEYDYIDFLINSFSFKLSFLQSTLSENKQLIRFSLLTGLLGNCSCDEAFVRERFSLLNITMEHPHFWVVILHFPDFKNALPAEKYEYIFYELIKITEQASDEEEAFYAVKTPDETIAIICNSKTDEPKALLDKLCQIKDSCLSQFAFLPHFSVSGPCKTLGGIQARYRQAQILRQDYFMMPDQPVLLDVGERPVFAHADQLSEDFGRALQEQNLAGIQQTLSDFIDVCHKGLCNYSQCQQILLAVLNILGRYIHLYHLKIDRNLYEEFARCNNIDVVCRWIKSVTENCVFLIAAKAQVKTSGIVEEVIQWMTHNLSGDYNLNSLADQFGVSANYLGKLFKEQMGMNFSDYLSDYRLEQAAVLLIQTKQSIETISHRTGFNSSAYFIQKFRKKFGTTPKNYRLLLGDKELDRTSKI